MVIQNVKTFRNANNDESLFVPIGLPFDQIPSPYRELIDDRYQSFLANPGAYIKSLAERTDFVPLRDWLSTLSQSERFGLIVHRADFYGHIQQDLTVCCINPRTMRQRFFRLPQDQFSVESLPYPLDAFYRVTDGIIETQDSFATSQFLKFRHLFFNFASSFAIETSPVSDLSNVLAFYETDTGDRLVADGEKAFAFCHEDRSFHECGTLTHLLESYFDCDRTGSKWRPFPYA